MQYSIKILKEPVLIKQYRSSPPIPGSPRYAQLRIYLHSPLTKTKHRRRNDKKILINRAWGDLPDMEHGSRRVTLLQKHKKYECQYNSVQPFCSINFTYLIFQLNFTHNLKCEATQKIMLGLDSAWEMFRRGGISSYHFPVSINKQSVLSLFISL